MAQSWLWDSQIACKKSEKSNQKQARKKFSFKRKQEKKDNQIEVMYISIR